MVSDNRPGRPVQAGGVDPGPIEPPPPPPSFMIIIYHSQAWPSHHILAHTALYCKTYYKILELKYDKLNKCKQLKTTIA